MPSASRLGDMTNGHGFPPKPIVSGSSNVFINGIPAARQGDTTPIHCLGPICHSGAIAMGSTTVFINGKPAARMGDPDCCGDTMGFGSSNVFIGG